MEDREVWRFNLDLLPPQPLRKKKKGIFLPSFNGPHENVRQKFKMCMEFQKSATYFRQIRSKTAINVLALSHNASKVLSLKTKISTYYRNTISNITVIKSLLDTWIGTAWIQTWFYCVARCSTFSSIQHSEKGSM